MTRPWMWRLVAAFIGFGVGLAAPGWAADERARASSGDSGDAFERVTDVDRYLNRGEVHATTLQMLRDVAVALHEEMEMLRHDVNQLTQEVRRLAAEKAR